ncbi:MAG: hypothetical protein JW874_11745 [Spirochaetales bacterium]|nr:hypothetical protein [Spirochaetales bacterium]
MALTSAIEQRLERIQQEASQGITSEYGQVLISAADIDWLILLARNTISREPAPGKRQRRVVKIVFYLLLSSVAVLSVAGLIWGIRALIRLF